MTSARPVKITDAHVIRMREHVAYLLERSPYYKERLRNAGVGPGDIRSYNDIIKLPATTKDDLARQPERFLCVPPEHVVEHVTTSGSLGDPVPFMLTEKDLQRLARNEQLSLTTAGVTGRDVVQITTTLDKYFMAGIAYWLGARAIGAGIVRSGPGDPQAQWRTAARCGTTVLIATPGFLLRMLTAAGGDIPASVRKVICIGEPIATSLGVPDRQAQRILELCDLQLHGTYASTEMATAFTEPLPFQGHLVPHELVFVELLNEDGLPVAEGEPGEVVATPWSVEGMPLLRFKTGDVCTMRKEIDEQGQLREYLGPVIGRKAQRMKVNGTTLYPQQIMNALNGEPAIRAYTVIRERDENGLDKVRIALNTHDHDLSGLKERLQGQLRIAIPIDRMEMTDLMTMINIPGERKPRRFIDLTRP